jgi:hypothetical protein
MVLELVELVRSLEKLNDWLGAIKCRTQEKSNTSVLNCQLELSLTVTRFCDILSATENSRCFVKGFDGNE